MREHAEATVQRAGISQELARWESYREWTRLPHSALLDRSRRWLEDNRPAGRTGVA